MVRDRLAEMQAKSAEATSPSKSKKQEKNGTPLLSSEDSLSQCLTKVSQIDDKIKAMRESITEMDKIQRNILTRPILDKNGAKSLEKLSDGIFSTSVQIQKDVNVFRDEMHAMHMDSHHENIIETHLKRLNAETTKASHEFRATQMDYIEKSKKLHHRKVEIVTGGDEAKGEELALDPSNIQHVFAGDYMMEAAKARQELREIEARDAEIKKVEGSVIEVNRLFKEINALIMEQGETIDTIESHINKATIEVENAGGQLKKANEYRAKARRKKVCCIGILVAVLIIAGVILAIILTQSSD